MDGNNRWSKKNNKTKYFSYNLGAKKLIDLSRFIFENYDINFVSAFALSKHNLKRGSYLTNIIKRVLKGLLDQDSHKNNYNFDIIFKGDLSFLPIKMVKEIKNLQKSNNNFKNKLIIYLNYSGRDDIIAASKSLNKNKTSNKLIFQKFSKSSKTPDPDMLIRSGGFKRLSDFFLYQVSFTDFFFTKTLWPDVKKSQIKKFINDFYKIERKFGI